MPSELMRLLTRDGVLDVPVERYSPEASTIGAYWNAVNAFLATGDTEVLEPFRDAHLGPYRLEVDPDWIEHWAYEGELDFPTIYSLR